LSGDHKKQKTRIGRGQTQITRDAGNGKQETEQDRALLFHSPQPAGKARD